MLPRYFLPFSNSKDHVNSSMLQSRFHCVSRNVVSTKLYSKQQRRAPVNKFAGNCHQREFFIIAPPFFFFGAIFLVKVEKLQFCNLYFADRHSKVVRHCPINVSHLSVKVFKVFCWKGIIHSLLSPSLSQIRAINVISNWLQFYRGQGIFHRKIYEWSQLMLTLPVMDTFFLSSSFPSTVCNTISLLQKTLLTALQKICISSLNIVLIQQFMPTIVIHEF